MEYSNREIRTWSILGQRGTFGLVLLDVANKDDRIIGLSADLCNTSGMDRFANKYPERFINTGIAEQNMIGVSGGIADLGYIPVATSFANFISLRSCEFVRHFLSYMQCNVKLIGLSAGFGMELFGNTHYGVEDIACMRSFPNVTILSPADGVEVVKCIEAAISINGAVYIRLTGKMNQPIVHKTDIDFEVGKSIVLREGEDVTVYATGGMVSRVLKAADILANDGIEITVVDVHSISPFDHNSVISNKDKRLIVSVEEHSIIGGLGSIIAESLSEKQHSARLLRLGVAPEYKKAGDYEYMLEQNRLTAEMIAEDLKKCLLNL